MNFLEFYNEMLRFAPMEISDRFVSEGAYDNSGIIIGTKRDVKTAVYCLDLTSKSVQFAISENADVIVTHHPAIYRPIKNLFADEPLLAAANAGIGVISNHLNLDGAKEGIDCSLMQGLGGKIIGILDDFDGGEGYGRVGLFDKPFGEIVENYKKEFGTDKVWAYGSAEKRITKAASFCGAGLGDEEVEAAVKVGAELVVSADIPHHVLLHALERGLCVLSCTHYGTENYGMKKFAEKCAAQFKNMKIYFFDDERFV